MASLRVRSCLAWFYTLSGGPECMLSISALNEWKLTMETWLAETKRPKTSCPSMVWMSSGLSGPEQKESVHQPPSQSWVVLGLWVGAVSLLYSTGARPPVAAFITASEGALLYHPSLHGPESWERSWGGWTLGSTVKPSLVWGNCATESPMCHKEFFLKGDFRIGCAKGLWWLGHATVQSNSAGKGLICSSFLKITYFTIIWL